MGRLFWGLVLAVLGVLLLAGNLGWLDPGFIVSLWRLWPLILVVIGINMILGERNRRLAVILTLVVVLAGLLFAWIGWQGGHWGFAGGQAVTRAIVQPTAGNVTSGTVRIDLGAAGIDLHGLAADRRADLVAGTLSTWGEPDITQSVTDGAYSLTVRETGTVVGLPFVGGSASGRRRLDLGLAPDIPWSLDLTAGASRTNLELSDVTVSDVTVDAGASSVTLVIGRTTPDAQVKVKGGAGSYHLTLPKDRRIELELVSSVSSRTVADGFRKTGDQTYVHDGSGTALQVRVEASVSSVRVDLR